MNNEREPVMKVSFARRSAAIAASAAALLLASNVSFAGKHYPGAVVTQKVTPIRSQPNAVAHFSCENRPFDLSQGPWCYAPDAIRKAYGTDALIAKGLTGKGRTI